MNKRTEQYLAHAENRIKICYTNALLWEAKEAMGFREEYGYASLAEEARKGIYKWIGLAQEQPPGRPFLI